MVESNVRMSNAKFSFVSNKVCMEECAMCDVVCDFGLKDGESRSDLVVFERVLILLMMIVGLLFAHLDCLCCL